MKTTPSKSLKQKIEDKTTKQVNCGCNRREGGPVISEND